MTLPQRPLRGSRISSFYPVKSLPSLSSLDSAFQLQEYISLLIRLDVHDVESIVSLPGKRKDAGEDTAGKSGEESDADKAGSEIMVDEPCWIYEQLRRLAQDLTHPLINMLQQECTRSTCPEMKAGEWLYLCVAHGNEGALEQCCAIDYILHTLDSATALLNTPRAFPSRLQIPTSSHRHFGSLARRLGRIFAHAYFHHREAFEQAEAESSLYARFLALTSKFELVPPEFMVIPPRPGHGGSDSDDEDSRSARNPAPPPSVHPAGPESHLAESESGQTAEGHWDMPNLRAPISTDVSERGTSPLGAGSDSPRKMGRGRTDTMVLNEAYAIAEELSKANGGRGSEQKKEVEKDLNSFSLLAKPEPESSTSDQSEADVVPAPAEEALHADVPIIPDQDQQSSPTSEDHAEQVPVVTPSSSTALPEADLTEVTAVNATPEISPDPHTTEFDEKDIARVAPVAAAAPESKEEEAPAPVADAAPAAEVEESKPPAEDTSLKDSEDDITPSSSTTLSPPSTTVEAAAAAPASNPEDTISASAALITDISGLSNAEPEPTVSAGDEVPDSPVVPREDREDAEVPSEVVPPPSATTTVEEVKEEVEPVVPVGPEVKEEKVESEMKELVEGKAEEKAEEKEESKEEEKVVESGETVEKEETPAAA